LLFMILQMREIIVSKRQGERAGAGGREEK
jgi:hypothetical protein